VQDILRDPELMSVGAAHVLCAPDPVGCWGVAELYAREYHLPITVLSGPATDNDVGSDYIRAQLGLPAHNALRDAPRLVAVVEAALRARAAAA